MERPTSLSLLASLIIIALLINAAVVIYYRHDTSLNVHHLRPITESYTASATQSPSSSLTRHLSEKEACFQEQPRPCDFDYEWRPLSPILKEPRLRNQSSGQWLPVKRPYSTPSRKLNILYFTHIKDYLNRMDRYYFDEIDAAITHPDLNIYLWGVDFPNYSVNLSTTQNIEQTFPGVEFDVIYSMDGHGNDPFPSSAVSVLTLGDCHWPSVCRQELEGNPFDDVYALRYAGLIMDWFRPDQWDLIRLNAMEKKNKTGDLDGYEKIQNRSMPFFFHHTDCAPETVYYPAKRLSPGEKWEDSRPTLLQLIGSTLASLYPLRNTIERGITDGIIQNATIFWHPGYDHINPNVTLNNMPIGVYTSSEKDTNVAHLKKHQLNFAQVMRETQICMFDSSIVRKAIRKYHEAFMSGCVVASDIPIEMEDMFRDVVIPLRQDMTAEEVNQVVHAYLLDKEKLEWMAREAFYRARQHWTCRNKVDRLLEVSAKVLQGEKGYWFPFGFSALCRTFVSADRAMWCLCIIALLDVYSVN
ncbi:hypothetical protein BCR33DRAFT_135266 [Rhizoclosmatium globosum]|uniref:Spore protein YkvP/CgeB glycosyl transferase-like domain-containing protein n=1 Tax=Rhizoclosmatium globosum TaxID=329046 RepID=A0A1Y2ALA5_9FUNG|nr:hypothetical protein BCR33DRAFT_135266 [Rhizoclosmatium globosum]|eukprot:ORY23343.1 hypothetical protein BCR33DRAFT_135266 [Rhizoclosmatium globosum]